MGYFDSIKESLSSAFDVNKETPEMRLANENLATAEKTLQEKIYELGQQFYQEHKDDEEPDETYGEMIKLIGRLDDNRIQFYQNKLQLTGQMMCENCGAIITFGSKFCNSCGENPKKRGENVSFGAAPAQEAQDASENGVRKCAKCGAEIPAGDLFCTECGWRVEG